MYQSGVRRRGGEQGLKVLSRKKNRTKKQAHKNRGAKGGRGSGEGTGESAACDPPDLIHGSKRGRAKRNGREGDQMGWTKQNEKQKTKKEGRVAIQVAGTCRVGQTKLLLNVGGGGGGGAPRGC